MKRGKVQDILVVLGILVVCAGGTFLGIGKLVFVTLVGLLMVYLHLTKERERKEWRYIVIGALVYLFIRLLYRVSYWEIIDVKQPDMSEKLLCSLYFGGSYFLYLSLILLISSILSKLWHKAIKAKVLKGKIWPALVVVVLAVSTVILYKTRMTQDIKLLSSNYSVRVIDEVMTRCMIFKHPPLDPDGVCSANLQYFAIFQARYGNLGPYGMNAKLTLGDRNGRVYWTKKWSGFTPFVSNIGVVCLIEGHPEGGYRLSFYDKHGKLIGSFPNEKSSTRKLALTCEAGLGRYQIPGNPVSLDGERYYTIVESEAEHYLVCILSSGDEVWSLKIEKMSLPFILRISRNGGYIFTDDTGVGVLGIQNFCRVYSVDGKFIRKMMVYSGDGISIPDDENLHISRLGEKKIDIYQLSTGKLIETKDLEEKEEEKDIRKLLKLTSHPNRSTRIEAVCSLGLMGDRRALPRLKWIAKWSRFDLRSAAIGAIGRIRDKDAVPFLIERLEKDEDWNVKSAAVRALGHIGDKRAVDPLITMLKKGLLVRPLSEALVEIGDKKAIGPLKELLSDANSWHREIGIKALVQMGDSSIVEDLRELLNDPDADADVRSAAAWTMAKLGVDDGYEVAIECIGIRDKAGARWNAIETLTLIGNKEAVPYLVKAMVTDGKMAAEALTKMIGEEATPIFVNGLTHEYGRVREASAKELGKIGSKREIPYLEKLLYDECYEVRQAARKSIEQIGCVGIR